MRRLGDPRIRSLAASADAATTAAAATRGALCTCVERCPPRQRRERALSRAAGCTSNDLPTGTPRTMCVCALVEPPRAPVFSRPFSLILRFLCVCMCVRFSHSSCICVSVKKCKRRGRRRRERLFSVCECKGE